MGFTMLGLRTQLVDVPLFKGLEPGEIDELFSLCEVRELKASQRLMAEGELADALWIILVGDVEISKEQKLLAEVGPGSVLGELSLFRKASHRSATVTAICPVTVIRIPVGAFRKLIAANNLAALKVVNNIAHQMAERLSAINDRLVSPGRKGLSVARSELRRVVL
jgi:CRP-like cAMP-binding protein